MTIAACYINPEGIVLGTDSTASIYFDPHGFHYLNHNQKLFEIRTESTFGIVTWGQASLGQVSHRTQIAILADSLKDKRPNNVGDVAERFGTQIGPVYLSAFQADLCLFKTLAAKTPFDEKNPNQPNQRMKDEEKKFNNLRVGLSLGFCIGGFVTADRTPEAYTVVFDPSNAGKASVNKISNTASFWGAPSIFARLIKGFDPSLIESIKTSGHWNGTEQDLIDQLTKVEFNHPILPIREAIDYIHVCIYSTIKAMKFSVMSQICGGPVEIATITTDRQFRWVRHKEWDSAIIDGDVRW